MMRLLGFFPWWGNPVETGPRSGERSSELGKNLLEISQNDLFQRGCRHPIEKNFDG